MNSEKIISIEIKRKNLLQRVANEATSYRVYNVHFKAFVKGFDGWYNFNDVVTIFDEDVCEYADKDYVGKKESNAIINEFVFFTIEADYVGLTLDKAREQQRQHIDEYNARL